MPDRHSFAKIWPITNSDGSKSYYAECDCGWVGSRQDIIEAVANFHAHLDRSQTKRKDAMKISQVIRFLDQWQDIEGDIEVGIWVGGELRNLGKIEPHHSFKGDAHIVFVSLAPGDIDLRQEFI